MEVKSCKFGLDRIPDTKENILRHREMSFIDIFLEKIITALLQGYFLRLRYRHHRQTR